MNHINFLSENAFTILEMLIKKKCYLRELAEETGLAPSSVHKTASQLVQKKIISTKNHKNRRLFELNYSSPITNKALSILILNQLLESKALKKLVKLKPIGIYLFGTAASGKITHNSDMDLCVFFETKPSAFRLSEIKRKISSEIKKEVQLIILTKQKIQEMKKQKNELLNQIKNNSITLHGEIFE